MASTVLRRLRRLPRVELHLHLEGSLTFRRWRQLRSGRAADPDLPADPGSLYRHASFPEFLRHFALVTRALAAPEDFGAVTSDLSRSLRRQGVVSAEVFLTPVIFTRRGLPFDELFDAITAAAESGRRAGGPSLAWILDGVRQWGARGMEETLECAVRAGGKVLGIGLGGDECSVPAREFGGLFAAARRRGLRTVVHAGEFAGAPSVREAVELLGAERIGHGIRAIEEPAVVRMLRRERIALDVCPTSNLRTRVVRRWRDHPLPRLVRSGLRVTLNSDDPALFRTSLSGEFAAAHRRLGLTGAELFRAHCDSIRSSFLPPARKRALLERSRRVWDGRGGRAGGKASAGAGT